jgi:aminopeptidase N
VTEETLKLSMGSQETATLEILTEISPETNLALNGLYMSDGLFCTQCEAEGFRRITYFLDRPDVMSTFTAKMIGDATAQPTLLSNGNCLEIGTLEGGRHWALWSDPFPKPAYLFALVAGDLGCLKDTFTTQSGREIDLRIYADPGNEAKCTYAMDALKRSMTWDEERFGLEYDLDIFMIVAVNAFNAGAMENKGLNIFNDKYVLVDPESATDVDYERVEGIVAHEYFHNWTGNRVTCRDWFQLCLKEGLTVFRDQEFTSDMRSRAVKRIEDVALLRRRQFAEDAGPLSHPVRPASFVEIDNFFTTTVYEKGAEVCGMIRTMVGDDGFRKGMDLYFKRHDGTAATVEQFVGAMADANGRDFTHFLQWYSQSGTPDVTVSVEQDKAAKTVDLHVQQNTRPTFDQTEKSPHHMPMTLSLLDASGVDLPLQLAGESAQSASTERVLELTEESHTFRFENISEGVTPSVFRDFSAPVNVILDLSEAQKILLMGRDSNTFNRWDQGQKYTLGILLEMVEALRDGRSAEISSSYLEALRAVLEDPKLDDDYKSLMLAVPSELEIARASEVIHVEEIHAARAQLRKAVGGHLSTPLQEAFQQRVSNEPFQPDHISAGKRQLKNTALGLLCSNPSMENIDLAVGQYQNSDNMTDAMAAMQILNQIDGPEREACLADFYDRWAGNPIVIDKWFQTQAVSALPGTLQAVENLLDDPAFSYAKPNKIYALIGAFANGNQLRFHESDGQAYEFLVDHILKLDKTNPEVAAGLMEAFANWRRFDTPRQALMKVQMERVTSQKSLSNNLFEIATKTVG